MAAGSRNPGSFRISYFPHEYNTPACLLYTSHCPEADWFMAHCLPCFTQNLDELTRSE